MKKLSIKDIIEFRGRSEKGKKMFVADLKLNTEKSDSQGGGGDYWTICVSAISNAYKDNDLQIIFNKINEFKKKHDSISHEPTKVMYQRNIEILHKYEGYNFGKLKPSKRITLIKSQGRNAVLTNQGLQIKVKPNHIFTFGQANMEEIGAIWFITRRDGYRKDELGMLAEILFKYLKQNFPKGKINPKYCLVIDVGSRLNVNYSQVLGKEIPAIFTSTIDEIKGLM